MEGLVAQLVGPLANQLDRTRTARTEHVDQHPEQHAQRDEDKQERKGIRVAEDPGPSHGPEGLNAPAVVEVERRGGGTEGNRAAPEHDLGGARVVAQRHGHVRMTLKRPVQDDLRHDPHADPPDERRSPCPDRRGNGPTSIDRGVHGQRHRRPDLERHIGALAGVSSAQVRGADVPDTEVHACRRGSSPESRLPETVKTVVGAVARGDDLQGAARRQRAGGIDPGLRRERRELRRRDDHRFAPPQELGIALHRPHGARPSGEFGVGGLRVADDESLCAHDEVLFVLDRELQGRRNLDRGLREIPVHFLAAITRDLVRSEHRAGRAGTDQHGCRDCPEAPFPLHAADAVVCSPDVGRRRARPALAPVWCRQGDGCPPAAPTSSARSHLRGNAAPRADRRQRATGVWRLRLCGSEFAAGGRLGDSHHCVGRDGLVVLGSALVLHRRRRSATVHSGLLLECNAHAD